MGVNLPQSPDMGWGDWALDHHQEKEKSLICWVDKNRWGHGHQARVGLLLAYLPPKPIKEVDKGIITIGQIGHIA